MSVRRSSQHLVRWSITMVDCTNKWPQFLKCQYYNTSQPALRPLLVDSKRWDWFAQYIILSTTEKSAEQL
jgi:hypothetical protein